MIRRSYVMELLRGTEQACKRYLYSLGGIGLVTEHRTKYISVLQGIYLIRIDHKALTCSSKRHTFPRPRLSHSITHRLVIVPSAGVSNSSAEPGG
jgi:hypothetical protein